MKKIFLILFVAAIVFASSFAPFAAAEPSDSPYAFARAFATAYSRRDAVSGEEQTSALFIKDALASFGYSVSTPECKYYDADYSGDLKEVKTYTYYHVIGTRDLGKEKTVVIGGYYGGFASQDAYGTGEGAEIALGVGILLSVAKRLSVTQSDYNIAIAFWGGVRFSDFNVEKCGVSLDKVALYIGVDAVAAGTHDYLYCDDVPRSHEKYFRNVVFSVGAELSEPPTFKRALSLYSEEGAYTYTHLGLIGVNHDFMNRDIPCAAFVGGDWEEDCGLYRYNGKTEISGTNLDTIDEIDKRNGGKEKTAARLQGVSDVIVNAVGGEGLKNALDSAEKEISGADLDSKLAYALITFIGGAAAIAFFLLLMFRQGKDRREEVWQETFERKDIRPEDVFPDPEEKKEEPSDRNDDDVFRF